MLTEFVLVRHGAYVEDSPERADEGRWDPPLSAVGQEQAKALGHRLSGLSWDGLYCSHLKRAIATATIAAACGLEASVDARWAEFYKGEQACVGGEPWPADYADHWRDGAWTTWPDGEDRAGFQARVRGAIDDAVRRHEGGRVLVITHGGVINEVLSMCAGTAPLTLFRTDLTSITRIGVDGAHWVVGAVNDVRHTDDNLASPIGVFAYKNT